MADADDLLDYEDEENTEQTATETAAAGETKKGVKGTYVSIHSSGFRDFLLKPEILRAIVDCGFEHPSEGESFLFVLSVVWTVPSCDVTSLCFSIRVSFKIISTTIMSLSYNDE